MICLQLSPPLGDLPVRVGAGHPDGRDLSGPAAVERGVSSSSPARVLGTGLSSLIPGGAAADDVDPVAAATGRRIVAQLSLLETVEVPVAVVTAAVELLGLLAGHPDPQAREAVEAVVERLRAAAGSSQAGR